MELRADSLGDVDRALDAFGVTSEEIEAAVAGARSLFASPEDADAALAALEAATGGGVAARLGAPSEAVRTAPASGARRNEAPAAEEGDAVDGQDDAFDGEGDPEEAATVADEPSPEVSEALAEAVALVDAPSPEVSAALAEAVALADAPSPEVSAALAEAMALGREPDALARLDPQELGSTLEALDGFESDSFFAEDTGGRTSEGIARLSEPLLEAAFFDEEGSNTGVESVTFEGEELSGAPYSEPEIELDLGSAELDLSDIELLASEGAAAAASASPDPSPDVESPPVASPSDTTERRGGLLRRVFRKF